MECFIGLEMRVKRFWIHDKCHNFFSKTHANISPF